MNDLTALEKQTIERAVAGDQKALEEVLAGVQDLVFNLSLRMLGLLPDAEDATQEILIKVMTRLGSFRQESSLTTWVFRIALNHLRDYKKGMFAQRPLSFEIYGEDIASGRERDVPDLGGGVDQGLLERELKLSCTNVMLQCLDAESRCIYVLGTMFRLDSRVAADILGLNPATYRQRLSRIRKKVGAFLGEYCGLGGGSCSCKQRTNYAIATHRIDPGHLVFPGLEECSYRDIARFTDAMEELDGLSQVFADLPAYRTPEEVRDWVRGLLASGSFATVMQTEGAKG
ncbi:RNA polymerase sigma factor [Bittarella massiliensis]|uniref:RNA polymerase sigma factor n=1 Tax=Bittarella massiliensis (ex Durand et al. 2017) TaxID=1720313 RepID=UPI00163CA015|nr:RNA polymerase sigma factor [Bittarella massiliensis (ex Durand et al. 2017)]MBC2869995.1 RNA polymerase sigma factor [Bittarella massiliensis (ex Durand et al. 2017)]